MTNDLAVQFNNVFEKYLVEILLDGKTTRESFTALRDVSFSIRKGEAVAIIGPNGAGKSTILRLIAGLLKPEAGEVKTHGRVGSLLDLGAGFHPELTGRDNLLLNASLYNFSRQEFDAKYEKILAFADIGKFINAPVRCYSQGMYVRLAFSLAIHVDPDILLIDDCLAVGDDEFRVKSLDKALEFKAKNKTIVFITHDFYLAKRMCKRGIYIKNGVIVKDSSVDEAISAYTQPLDVDRSRYKYLAAEIEVESQVRKLEEEQWRAQEQKKLEEEKKKWRDEEQKRRKREEDQWRAQEQRKLEEEKKKWRDEEQKRQKREEDQWRVQKEEWKKEEENKWRGEEEKKRRREKEIKKAGVFLSAQPSFRLNVGQGKVEIIYNQEKMTRDFGMRVLFAVDGIDTDSSAAAWRIRKKSEKHIIVFLKWPRAKAVFQMWSFKWEEGNAINCEMWTRSKSFRTPENERVEFCLSGANQAFDEDGLGNKIRIFYCGEHNKISIETFCEDQVFGVSPNPHGFFMPFFLKENLFLELASFLPTRVFWLRVF